MAMSTLQHYDNNLSAEKEDNCADKCGICESTYSTPKTLKCLHSFCLKCLGEKVDASDTEVACPTCNEVTELPTKGVAGLKTNFMLIEKHERSLLEKQLKEKDSCIPCTSCENDTENKAVAWCRQCQDYMCETAVKYHKEQRISSTHEVVSLEKLQSEGVPKRDTAEQKERMCPKHTDEKLKFFCETCDVPFCRDCQVIDHPRGEHHAQVYLEDAIRKRSGDIQKEAENCKQISFGVDDAITQDERVDSAHRKAVEQTLNAYDSAAKQIQDKFSEIQTEHRNKFLADLTTFDEARKQDIDSHREKMKNVRSRIGSALSVTDLLAETGTQYDVADMYKDVMTALRELREIKPKAMRMSEVAFKLNDECLPMVEQIPAPGTFKLGALEWELKREIGNGNLSGVRGLAFTTNDGIVVADYSARAAHFFDNEGALSTTIAQGTAGFNHPFDVMSAPDGYYYITDLSTTLKVINAQMQYYTNRTVGGGSYGGYGIAVMKDGGYAVCCRDIHMIYVYNSGNTQLKTVPVMQPNFLSITSEDNFVVTSNNQKSVLVINGDGRLLQVIGPPADVNITSWNPQGVVCSKDDEIYVANRGEGAMGIYRFKVSGEFTDCITSDLNNPWGLALSQNGEQLAVVDNNGTSVKVFGHKY